MASELNPATAGSSDQESESIVGRGWGSRHPLNALAPGTVLKLQQRPGEKSRLPRPVPEIGGTPIDVPGGMTELARKDLLLTYCDTDTQQQTEAVSN